MKHSRIEELGKTIRNLEINHNTFEGVEEEVGEMAGG